MTDIGFERRGWIEATLGDVAEDRTFARLVVRVGDALITRNFSKRGGGESEAINVPIYPLARTIAERWWPLLYEPVRSVSGEGRQDEIFRARHRLDTGMHGYVFPALALCSAGEDAVLADWLLVSSDMAAIEFLAPTPPEPVSIDRTRVETALMDLVEAARSRVRPGSTAHVDLNDAWDRVTSSMGDREELDYCVAAGRLGIDPYDPEGPDLSALIDGLSSALVNDVSEAVELAELEATTAWIRQVRRAVLGAPTVPVAAFGPPLADDLGQPAWVTGKRGAEAVRRVLGLDPNRPRQTVQQLLDGAVQPDRGLYHGAPSSIAALVSRVGDVAHIGAVGQSARQQRFRACAATYVAWATTEAQEERAATIASTRMQQASRAFAAELMAPTTVLRDRAGRFGLTADSIDAIADEFICPHDAVVLQAFNAGIAMRGVEVPVFRRASIA